MNIQNAQDQPSVVTDYLDYFGLQDDPFSADLLPFYDGGPRRELFAELLHLCQFSPSLLVVLGEEGVGKSSLQTAMCQHFSDQDLVCDIEIPVLSNSAALLDTVAARLAIDDIDSSDIGQAIATIRTSVQNAEDDDSLKVIMIQNAHNLDAESLRVLLRLAAPGEQSPYLQLHIVLFATPDFEQRLPTTDDALYRVFHLPPIAPNEMKHYLRFRLDAAGFSGLFPFKDSDIQFLWDISKGVPAKFHDAAREILIEMALPPPESKSLGLPVTHMAAVVLLLAGLLGIFFYRGAGDDEDATSVVPANTETAPAPSVATNGVEAAGEEIDTVAEPAQTMPPAPPPATGEVVSAPVAETQPEVESATETAENTTPIVAETPPVSEQPAATAANVREASREDEIDALLAAAQQELQEENLQAPAPEAVSPTNLTNDETKLLSSAPDNYTLQILAGSSRDAVQDFIDRQPNREQLSVFTAHRDGKTLYIVVMGSFDSSESARLAVSNLPREQRRAGPWPRSLQSVQADIREFRGF